MLQEILTLDVKKNFWVTYTDFEICFTGDNIKNSLDKHF